MAENRFDRGLKKLEELHGTYGSSVLDRLDLVAPDLKRWIIEFAFGEVYCRPGLEIKLRQVATVAALVALRHGGDELKSHIRAALQAGCSRQEVMEVIMQMALYAGFPAAIGAVADAGEAFAELDAGLERPAPPASPE